MPKAPRQRLVAAAAVVLAAALLLGGCMVTKDSPAPGCVKRIGLPLMGGCNGKTIIQGLSVNPAVNCLEVTANNCNGGVLEVRNNCADSFALPGAEVRPDDGDSFDLVWENGAHALVFSGGNYSDYVPAADEQIELVGTLGAQEVRIRFIKTAPLCN